MGLRLKELVARAKALGPWYMSCGAIRFAGMCPVSCLNGRRAGDYMHVGASVGLPIEITYAVADAADNRNEVYRGDRSNLTALRAHLLKELVPLDSKS